MKHAAANVLRETWLIYKNRALEAYIKGIIYPNMWYTTRGVYSEGESWSQLKTLV